jgi:hypothetical protein
MRSTLRALLLACCPALVVACGENLTDPGTQPADSAQIHGTLLLSGERLSARSSLAWIPGSDLLAFATETDAGCAVKTVNVISGVVRVIDDDCQYAVEASQPWASQPYQRNLVAAPAGTALYYGVLPAGRFNLSDAVLREAEVAGGGVTTLRPLGDAALAIAPGDPVLAFRGPGDSLIVRDLASGLETAFTDALHLGASDVLVGPIAFSPNGAEVLYEVRDMGTLSRRRQRLSIADGTTQDVAVPVFTPDLFRWGPSGISVVDQVLVGEQWEYRVLDLADGRATTIGVIVYPPSPYEIFVEENGAWSDDGTRIAYWTYQCLDWEDLFDCGLWRYALFVADAQSGERERVAYSDGMGPTAFSPDGRRLVYSRSGSEGDGGSLYIVGVP